MNKTLEELEEDLTCTMCKERKERYTDIVYSQGDKVCLDCKNITQPADNAAFDRDMRFIRTTGSTGER